MRFFFLLFLLLISATVFMFDPRPFNVPLPSGVALPAATSSALLKLVRQRGTAWDLKRLRLALAPVAPDAIANGPATLRLTVRLHVSSQGVLVCCYVLAHLGCSRGTAVDVGRERGHRVVRPAGGPCRGAAVVPLRPRTVTITVAGPHHHTTATTNATRHRPARGPRTSHHHRNNNNTTISRGRAARRAERIDALDVDRHAGGGRRLDPVALPPHRDEVAA